MTKRWSAHAISTLQAAVYDQTRNSSSIKIKWGIVAHKVHVKTSVQCSKFWRTYGCGEYNFSTPSPDERLWITRAVQEVGNQWAHIASVLSAHSTVPRHANWVKNAHCGRRRTPRALTPPPARQPCGAPWGRHPAGSCTGCGGICTVRLICPPAPVKRTI